MRNVLQLVSAIHNDMTTATLLLKQPALASFSEFEPFLEEVRKTSLSTSC